MKTVVYAMLAGCALAALGCGDKTPEAKPLPAATATATPAKAAPVATAKPAAPAGW
jgi:hypothetical protein